MKKNGFTLIELLAVLAILAILALLITPTVFNSIEKFKNDSNDKQIRMVESATSNWASDKLTQFLPGTYYITIGDLKAEGYLDKNFKDLTTNKNYPNDANIKIEYTGKNYKVSYIKNSGTASIESNLDNNGPRLKLTGDSITKVPIGGTFTDQGVTAYSNTGSNITSSVTKTIKQNNSITVSSISTTSVGNYVIYYKIVSNGVTHVITRNVFVYDPDPGKTLTGTANVNISNGLQVAIRYTVSKSSKAAYLQYDFSNLSGAYHSGLGNSFGIYVYIKDTTSNTKTDKTTLYMMNASNNYIVNGLSGNSNGKVTIPLSSTSYNNLELYLSLNNGPEVNYPISISWSDSNLK